MKRIVTVQDISCVGRCSLTVALPIISAMGVEASALPTAVLSTHTMFESPSFLDLTDEIPAITAHWRRLGLSFDGIYTGYLGSIRQLELVEDFIGEFRGEGLVFVDPAMADNGQLYSGFTGEFVGRMRDLCACADIIVPNATEAALLLGAPYEELSEGGRTEELLVRLTELGPRTAIITGVTSQDGSEIGAAAFDSATGKLYYSFGRRHDGMYHGTGDIFASVCMGALVGGLSVESAIRLAADYVCECISLTEGSGRDRAYGVNFELALPKLIDRMQKYSSECDK